MDKEMLDILNVLSKKPTTELALQIMELSSENLILEQQCKKQKEVISRAIEYIKSYKTDYSPYELSDYNVRQILDILKEVSE